MRLLRWRALAGATVVAAVLTLVPAVGAFSEQRPAFDPADIISDDSFFNPNAMTAADIQEFLEDRTCVPKDDSPCLDRYRVDTPAVPASRDRCTAMRGQRDEPASSIIARVAKACTISPQVLLVLLQKEQSLLTAPSASGYQKATGYACPDTAACDTKFFGFFNQVYRAAWQFREYTVHPDDWRYRVGSNDIQFHPNAACGSSTVKIVNQATANLYNYTPYQPNDETLANPKGPAGSCSTFGNLNFSRLYSQWFGSPLAVRFSGWVPACLNYADGFGCPPIRPFDGM
ncbi:hypothetical protein ACFVWR_04765 [Leifsonia sp. NPDC058292]|uniref:hypothetical protein n=1 Tax=Leifsonia sp. NPDC058292 TaxID=3346428 RepID=UPI0036D7864D